MTDHDLLTYIFAAVMFIVGLLVGNLLVSILSKTTKGRHALLKRGQP